MFDLMQHAHLDGLSADKFRYAPQASRKYWAPQAGNRRYAPQAGKYRQTPQADNRRWAPQAGHYRHVCAADAGWEARRVKQRIVASCHATTGGS